MKSFLHDIAASYQKSECTWIIGSVGVCIVLSRVSCLSLLHGAVSKVCKKSESSCFLRFCPISIDVVVICSAQLKMHLNVLSDMCCTPLCEWH